MKDIEAISHRSRKGIMERLRKASRGKGLKKPPDPVRPVISYPSHDEVLSLLRLSLMRMKADLTELSDGDAVPAHVASILKGLGAPRVVVIGRDDGIRAFPWEEAGLKVLEPSSIESDYAGVSRALCAVAETGSVVFCSGGQNPTTVNFMVRHHFALIRRDQIVPYLEDLWGMLRTLDSRLRPRRVVNMIGGPSATADVEATLTVGAHGPCRFELLVIDGPF
jgi:L-lactate utilization protein LutC